MLGGATRAGCSALINPCRRPLPRHLREDDLVRAAWKNIDPKQMWGIHVHLIGSGDSGSGCWVNPEMDSWANPLQHIAIKSYKNATCIKPERGEDNSFVGYLLAQMERYGADTLVDSLEPLGEVR